MVAALSLHCSTLLFLAALWICSGSEAKRRNVLFIVVDDLRPELGAYNASIAYTPNLDRFAKEGVTFKRAYVQYAVCSPSRNSFMSGRRPDTTQAWTMLNHFREKDIGPDWASLPGYFRQNGYATLGSGKLYHAQFPPDNDYAKSWSQDWPYFNPDCRQRQCPSSEACPKFIHPRCLDHVGDKSVCVADIPLNETVVQRQLEDMWVRDDCIKRLGIAKDSGKNFFVGCGLRRPHVTWMLPAESWSYFPQDLSEIPLPKHPYMPTGMPDIAYHMPEDVHRITDLPYNTTPNATQVRIYRRAYYAAVAYQDYNIGKILDAVEEMGLKNDTAVLVIGDHGFHLGEYDTFAKLTNFEIAVRIPMILRAPWLAGAQGTVTDVLAEAVDIYPTLVELAGLPDPAQQGEELNGTSLVRVLQDPHDVTMKRAAFSQIAKQHRDQPFEANAYFKKEKIEVMGYSVRVDEWRYTAWFGVPKGTLTPNTTDVFARELYSHTGDDGDFDFGGEFFNVVADPKHKTIVAELHQMILEYIQVWRKSNGKDIALAEVYV